MTTSSVTIVVDNPFSPDDGEGSAFNIGDDVFLTVGHNLYFMDYEPDPTNRQASDVRLSSTFDVALDQDWRDFGGELLSRYQSHTHDTSVSNDVNAGRIYARSIPKDWLIIEKGGDVDSSDPGIVLFLDASDLTNSAFGMTTTGDDIRVSRDGAKTSDNDGTVVTSISIGGTTFAAGSGRAIHNANNATKGDSGTAVILEFGNDALAMDGRDFVLGTVVSIRQETVSGGLPYGRPTFHYFSQSDFAKVNQTLQSYSETAGNVTDDEPTNLIVGSSSADGSIEGSFRRDIILGRGGADRLNDGDGLLDLFYADDQLFGGGDADTFEAGGGNDLLHGGDWRAYGGSSRTWSLEDDGEDTVSYTASALNELLEKGFTVLIAPASSPEAPEWTFGASGVSDATNDKAKAIYVIDSDTSAPSGSGSDTLISIETINLTETDDIVRLDVIDGNETQFAGADGKGGIAKIDMKGNVDGITKGDLIDASRNNAHLDIDLSGTSQNVKDRNAPDEKVLTVVNAERVWTGSGEDHIKGNDEDNEIKSGSGNDEITGGKGNDIIDGGDGADDFAIFSGDCMDYDFVVSGTGAGRTVTITHARGSMEDGEDTLTNVEWARFANGEEIDLTVEDPGCKGQDIAFVVDTTGSMWDDLASVKSSASAVIDALFDPSRGFSNSRVAVVEFNDPYTSVVLPFTDQEDIAARKSAALGAINSLYADGGGDFPEYTYTGLLRALDGSIGSWREDASSRKIVLFGDATAKDAGLAGQVYALAANVNADLSAASAVAGLSLSTMNAVSIDPVSGERSVVSVQIYTVAIGGWWETEQEYAEIAAATGGLAFTAATANDLVDALLEVITLPIYSISIGTDIIVEGNEGEQYVTVTIRRDVADDAATVTLSTFGNADGDDVTGLPATVEFAAGQRTATFEIAVLGDEAYEADEVFGIAIASISEDASYSDRDVTLTIENDDELKAVLVHESATMLASGHSQYPFLTWQLDNGEQVSVHQVPFKQITDEDDLLPIAIYARDSDDAKAMVDEAVLTQYGLAVFDGDDPNGNGREQGIDGDEVVVFEFEDDADFDFATGALIQLAAVGDHSAEGFANFYLDDVLVATVEADENGLIDADLAGTAGFDRVELAALGDSLFTVNSFGFSDFYANVTTLI